MAGTPTLAEVIRFAMDNRLLDVHTALPGRVHNYYPDTQTADINPVVRRAIERLDGEVEFEDLPLLLYSVPIAWPRGGGYYLHFPLSRGDDVLLIFPEVDPDGWRVNYENPPKQVFDPATIGRHGLSGAFAIPGIAQDRHALTDAPGSGEAVAGVAPGGKLRVSTPNPAHVEPVALAQKVASQLTALKDAISNWTPVANDGGAALKTALTALFTDWPGDIESTTLEAEGEPE